VTAGRRDPVIVAGPRGRGRRSLAFAALLAGAIGCAGAGAGTEPPDPCAYAAPGAPWVAFSTAEGGSGWDIHVVRADGTCRRALTSDAVGDFNPAWAPGGVVAFESDRAPFTSIWLASLQTSALRRVDVGNLVAASPAISPDGATLAFEAHPVGSTTSSIYVAPLAGGAPVEVVRAGAAYGNGGPAFAPDGSALFFVSNRTGAYEIYRVPVAGGVDPGKVTTGAGILGKPAVSPDGATLAYTRQLTGATYEVVLHDLVHGTRVPLGVSQSAEPAFDPAGGRLVVRVAAARTNLELVSLPFAGASAMTSGPGPDGAPAVDRWRAPR
jgi:TolB protein